MDAAGSAHVNIPCRKPGDALNLPAPSAVSPESSPEIYGATTPVDPADTVPALMKFQGPSVDEGCSVLIPRTMLDRIFRNDRFVVVDGKGAGFSPDEQRAILCGSNRAFNVKLNVAVQAQQIIGMHERLLDYSLPWPKDYFTYYLNETDYARQKAALPETDGQIKEKLGTFAGDLSRSMELYRTDHTKVFINMAPTGEARMPAFNVGKLEVTLSPYPSRKNLVSTIHPEEESDSLAHELGHLSHAAIRPGWDESKYGASSDFETCALRESFGDLTALFHALSSRHIRTRVLEETGGNLALSNCASRICEDGGGDMLSGYFNSLGTPPAERYLRDLVNDFTYREREEAPSLSAGEPNVGQLYNDVYSYSQIFSGAVYDIMAAIYRQVSEQMTDREKALGTAADETARLLDKGTELSPWWKPDFKSLARCMITIDLQDNGGKYGAVLKDAFTRRNILSPGEIEALGIELSTLPYLEKEELPGPPGEVRKTLLSRGLLEEESDSESTITLQNSRTNGRGETILAFSLEKPFKGDAAELPFDLSTAYYADICDLTPDVQDRASLVMKFDSNGKLMAVSREGYHHNDRAQNHLRLYRE